ncbi:MAG: FixH family protein [Alphaproteobacteria bacterium]|nr:FixH family protein [Alphaproteobacteria bacterium]
MTRFNNCVGLALLAGLMTTGVLVSAKADVKDFEFQLIQNELKKGDAVVVVRLVDKRTKAPVPNAVIFAKRIDMAPDGMATMAEKVEELPSTVPGEYRFTTNLSMQGRWQLSLGAKVQGETGSVQGKLIVKALP